MVMHFPICYALMLVGSNIDSFSGVFFFFGMLLSPDKDKDAVTPAFLAQGEKKKSHFNNSTYSANETCPTYTLAC